MGQGVNTKMQAIAARELGAELEKVRVTETSSSVSPNAPPTAASVGSDLSGGAVLDACRQIAARLKPYREHGLNFRDAAKAAYADRVSLTAEGYYKAPWGSNYDWQRGTGEVYTYFTFGLAFSSVRVSLETGDLVTDETRILMDVGRSLNPALDIGQIEGAFMQGVGLFTCEQVRYDNARGHLISDSLHTYQLPSFRHVPRRFHVTLWPNSPNARAVHGSRAVGEPPLFLGYSVAAAAKDAIFAVTGKYSSLNAPLTSPVILNALNRK